MKMSDPETGVPQFYIPATASLLERRPRTLKHGDTFAMFDHYGDLAGGIANPEGLYHQDTRYLSMLRLEIEGRRPLLLSSTVENNNALLTVDLTNPDIYLGDDLQLRRDSVHLLRSKFLWASSCYEAIVVHNYLQEPRTITVSLQYEADFRDVFEVRGLARPRRGVLKRFTPEMHRVVLRYTGIDERVRDTELVFDPAPDRLSEQRAEWRVELAPGARKALFVTAVCGTAGQSDCRFVSNLRRAHRARQRASWTRRATRSPVKFSMKYARAKWPRSERFRLACIMARSIRLPCSCCLRASIGNGPEISKPYGNCGPRYAPRLNGSIAMATAM